MTKKLIIGSMRWGEWGAKLSTKQVAELLTLCVENGLNTFDSADIYGGYTTEQLLGSAFRASKLPRDSYKIISKCGIQYPCAASDFKVKAYNLSKEYLVKATDKILKDLQTDYIDQLLIHRPSPLMDYNQIAEAFEELRLSGKVKSFGVSNFTPEQFLALDAKFKLTTNQLQISLTHPDALLNEDLLPLQTKGLSPQAWSPLGGLFTKNNEQVSRIEQAAAPLTEKYSCSLPQLALAFLWKHPSHIQPVIGSSKWENIATAKQAMHIDLSLEDWFLLLEASRGERVA